MPKGAKRRQKSSKEGRDAEGQSSRNPRGRDDGIYGADGLARAPLGSARARVERVVNGQSRSPQDPWLESVEVQKAWLPNRATVKRGSTRFSTKHGRDWGAKKRVSVRACASLPMRSIMRYAPVFLLEDEAVHNTTVIPSRLLPAATCRTSRLLSARPV